MTSENPVPAGSQPPETTSENTQAPSTTKRRGHRPPRCRTTTPTSSPPTPRRSPTCRSPPTPNGPTSRGSGCISPGSPRPPLSRRSKGDPLTNPKARDWAVRDYRLHLLRDAQPKRSVRYSNNALAALDDFHIRLGLGKGDISRDDLPKTAPKALDGNAQVRWLRAIENWPHTRDRLLALLPFYAGLRIGDAVALDVPDVRMSARKGVLVVYGKGGKIREVPIHPQLREPLTGWLDERPTWSNAATEKALFLNRRGGRLTARGASDVFTAIGQAAASTTTSPRTSDGTPSSPSSSAAAKTSSPSPR
ncbi:tyrosine recombinase XerC [Streptosporangium lutulentum]